MKPTSIQKGFVVAASLVVPGLGQAHPGHMPAGDGLAHWLGSPLHFLGALAAATLVAVALRIGFRDSRVSRAPRERG